MTRARNPIGSLVVAGIVAFAFSVAPVGLDDDFAPETKSAFAKGKGSGNSGGKGGGKRSGKSSGKGGSGSGDGIELEDAHGKSNGLGHAKANGNGHNKDGELDTASHGSGNGKGALASALGNLNAAHASPTALAHASENSRVGMLALYANAVAGDPDPDAEPPVPGLTAEEQREALGGISNKADDDGLVDADVVAEVNSLLGID